MGESITQAIVVQAREAVTRVLGALEAVLRETAASATDRDAAADVDVFARLVASVRIADLQLDRGTPQERLAVCAFRDAALRVAGGPAHPLAEALALLMPWLSWTQNPNYRNRPPSATFLDNYGYAVIAGPSDGPPALIVAPRFACGVLLLGPCTLYPLHAHPAVEVYYTLTPGDWWRNDGPWRTVPPGVTIHHAPNVRHATRAEASPLLAIYLWRGDLGTHARLL